MSKYFGTDGYRGEAGVELTAPKAFKTGRYLGYYLKNKGSGRRPKVVIGKDTRLSSYMLEYSIAAGLATSGADVYLLHVTTTPSVSYVTLTDGFDAGVMITASHNPYYDNGIKIINRYGAKLGDEVTELIEGYIEGTPSDIPMASGDNIGRIHDYYSGRNRYIGYLISLVSNSYKSLKIGLDSANGAASKISRSVFSALGAKLYTIGDEPNGTNVNDECGSTSPEKLAEIVKKEGLDVGFAFDGDGDRCIAIDSNGEIVDGDKILYILAKRLKRQGALYSNKVIATVMSNGGLKGSLSDTGIEVETTQVGDRFVYEKMISTGAMLGGEQSGHIIIRKYATTGDGLLTALMITEEMIDRKESLCKLSEGFVVLPQASASVKVKSKKDAISDPKIKHLITKINEELAPRGRLIVRESGTEPKIRIMVECESEETCKKHINLIRDLLSERGHIDG